MNFLTYIVHLASSSAVAYYSASQIRDPKTRPNVLVDLQQAELGTVSFLQALSDRATAEGNARLAEKLTKHAADEKRHGLIFTHALKEINKQGINLPSKTDRQRSKELYRVSFTAYYEGYTEEQLKANVIDWDVFMASTYILELDGSGELTRMANALPEDNQSDRKLKLGMLSIAKDETYHAAYLYEAMMERMSATQVQKLVDHWRTRKLNALMAIAGTLL
ncbi:ferritin-like domain-containing protein [Aetokthonos hydrillicola Thurmond2011]|jgi:rubrerythrin|uniref:Ferritin-like domain-containing protein n=1 Tax=Aetokthonos hydrillicola Thurmond2011 TaxID=2712845 RepID=A0AAP5I6S0_9CYAN|nr:ferritin-like domain-containing protein [Aetokthonos hydrillicola]MBO3457629.1 ferritin-like domain-containing protein [Aetokthonos hydrillicola CCALA 1050]MBW4587908.1 ferritin-like domain-containing protein [Aetokthonos hydrillicola CCALA 1050]MDR9894687.1 ferritin-like domain-containing protein [Aetokthonos hydrillicola Thurmond2011]